MFSIHLHGLVLCFIDTDDVGFSVVYILLSLLKNIESHILPWELPQNHRPSMRKMDTTEKQNEMINESPC